MLRQVEVEFDYRKPGERSPSRRHVQPYHLAHRENLWYLVGFDVGRAALRTFALPRITAVAAKKSRFVRPGRLLSGEVFRERPGHSRRRGQLPGGDPVRRRGGRPCRESEWHESQQLRDLPSGGLELRLRLGALAEVERWVLGWGAAAEVLEPVELRDQIARTVKSLAAIYGVD